jgi:gallate decarboxylase subunit C
MRPTRIGPAMTFNNVSGHPGSRVLVGLLASGDRVSRLLGAPSHDLGVQMGKARKLVTPPERYPRRGLVPIDIHCIQIIAAVR